MNAKHLLQFIKHKLRFCPDEIVIHRDGEFLQSEVFHSLNLTAYDLSVDTLDMHAVRSRITFPLAFERHFFFKHSSLLRQHFDTFHPSMVNQ